MRPRPRLEPGPHKRIRSARAPSQTGSIRDVSLYDKIAHLYDPWSLSVVEDIEFYVEEARRSGGPVVELAVGTGRIAVPIAAAGSKSSASTRPRGCSRSRARAAADAGVEVDLRHGDLRDPPVEGTFPLVIIAFRSLLHMQSDADRRAALRAVTKLLEPGGRFVFDVFAPAPDDIEETHGRWIEREEGIFERADWDEDDPHARAQRARPRRRDVPQPRLAVRPRMAQDPARGGGLRGRRALWLVRPHAVGRTRGLDLGLP